jgi:hypothetical protein
VILSQGIQDPQWVTPLVTGRDAVVRVFLACPAAGNTQRPTVNVILTNALGVQTLNSLIPAPGLGIPSAPVVGNINDSWNLSIPGALVQPGTSLQVSLVADAQSAGLTQTTWPASGTPKALNPILPDNQLRMTLVPVILASAPGFPGTTGRVVTSTQTAADWVKVVRQLYPLGSGAGSLDLQVLPAWDSGLSIVEDPADQDRSGHDTEAVRLALERVRKATQKTAFRFYAGIFTLPAGGRLLGLGAPGEPGKNVHKTFMSSDFIPYANNGDAFGTFAHELGHDLGRYHSPCGPVAGPDPLAPANGYLGTWGLDIATQVVKDPQLNRDLMGYCQPQWISQYTYTALQRAMGLDQAAFTAGVASTNAILVSGMILPNGTAALDPFLEIMDVPEQADPGPYTLTLYNAQHTVITTVPFQATSPTDGDGGDGLLSFCFDVDLTPAQEVAVASATVTGPGVAAPAAQLSRAAAFVPRDPVAVTWRGGVHLGWDQGVYPEVMVRDPRSGDIIATARTGEVDLDTDAPVLELVMLDGIHTVVRSVKVGS